MRDSKHPLGLFWMILNYGTNFEFSCFVFSVYVFTNRCCIAAYRQSSASSCIANLNFRYSSLFISISSASPISTSAFLVEAALRLLGCWNSLCIMAIASNAYLWDCCVASCVESCVESCMANGTYSVSLIRCGPAKALVCDQRRLDVYQPHW